MSATLSPAELAALVDRRQAVRISPQAVAEFLRDWLAAGVVEEPVPGRYRLTASGRAMFGGWASGIGDEEPAT